ncbi:MAG: hypothetical protein WHT65_03120 [Pseudothermotoga sp.]
MWVKDEKMVRSLKISSMVTWAMVVFFLLVLSTVGVEYYFVIMACTVEAFVAVLITAQYKNYSQGIFLSDFEIVLPGVRQHKINSQDLERVIVQNFSGRSDMRYALKFKLRNRRSYTVGFSSTDSRREVVELLSEFCPHVEIVDKTKKIR